MTKNKRMIRGVRMNYQVVIPVLVSFAISLILGPVIIPFLRKLKMGQTERVEGVQSHLKKAVIIHNGLKLNCKFFNSLIILI